MNPKYQISFGSAGIKTIGVNPVTIGSEKVFGGVRFGNIKPCHSVLQVRQGELTLTLSEPDSVCFINGKQLTETGPVVLEIGDKVSVEKTINTFEIQAFDKTRRKSILPDELCKETPQKNHALKNETLKAIENTPRKQENPSEDFVRTKEGSEKYIPLKNPAKKFKENSEDSNSLKKNKNNSQQPPEKNPPRRKKSSSKGSSESDGKNKKNTSQQLPKKPPKK